VAHFRWSEITDLCVVCSVGKRIMNEAGDFRLRDGITFSFPTVEAGVLGFSVAAEKLDFSDIERLTMQFVAAYGLGCAMTIGVSSATQEISRRQREALLWASEGLTINQIADRMNVSSHTADMHLRLAREKLGVTSSIHAVAEALRRGLIS
jgi:LuxR family quorum sensing-dependent transcriptional regulator